MESNPNQELKVITAGKVYRRDEDDATHTHQFTQIEGFVVGRDISFAYLKGTLELVLKKLFGENHPIRFRPSYFPFTEPSVEVDAQCPPCRGQVTPAGKDYRREEDHATHTRQLTQIEGFVVGRDISFAYLKGTLELVLKKLFGENHPIRFRPSYFPFTEPSVEVDAQCPPCRGQGCNICKKTG
ncbi:12912_t:CDS:2 [Entrophospora sp. SA101]|nr:12912_t:CDS:2 [Entrophospora sp. SA101]